MKQHSSELLTTFSLLKTIINFRSCLFSICLPLLTPSIMPSFSHVSKAFLFVSLAFVHSWFQSFLSDRTQFPSVALNPVQLFSSLVSLRGQFLDQLSSFCTVSLSLLLSVTIISFITASLMTASFIFRLANSVRLPILDFFVFHPLTSSLLVDGLLFIKHHYFGTVCPTLPDTLLPSTI